MPENLKLPLLKDSHGGKFSGHFALRKKYWWKGMCGEVEKFCRECTTRKGSGRAVRPPLSPIPVGGPFHRMLQLPLTESGNRYMIHGGFH